MPQSMGSKFVLSLLVLTNSVLSTHGHGSIAALIEKIQHIDVDVFANKMDILNMEERLNNEIDLTRLSLRADLLTSIVPKYMENEVKNYIVQTLRSQSLEDLLNSQLAVEMRQLKQSLQQLKRQKYCGSERIRTKEERHYDVSDKMMKSYLELKAKVEFLERNAEESETRHQRLENEMLNLSRSHQALDARVKVLGDMLKGRETQLQNTVNLSERVNELETVVEMLEKTAGERQTRLQQLESENAELHQSCNNTGLEERTKLMEHELEERESRLRQLESNSINLQSSVEKLNKDFEVSENMTRENARRYQRLEYEDEQLKNLSRIMYDRLSDESNCSTFSTQEFDTTMASSTITTNSPLEQKTGKSPKLEHNTTAYHGYLQVPLQLTVSRGKNPIPHRLETCGEGWREMHRACYKFDKRKMTWGAAKLACREEGGNLISINSYAEKKKITRELQKEITQNDLLTWWVGLRWNAAKRWFLWEDGGPFSRRITRWGPGEPNNGRGRRVEHCVELKYNGFVNDEECSELRPFICERHESEALNNGVISISTCNGYYKTKTLYFVIDCKNKAVI